MKQILLHVTEEEKVLAVLDEGVLSDISVEKAEETDLVGACVQGRHPECYAFDQWDVCRYRYR